MEGSYMDRSPRFYCRSIFCFRSHAGKMDAEMHGTRSDGMGLPRLRVAKGNPRIAPRRPGRSFRRQCPSGSARSVYRSVGRERICSSFGEPSVPDSTLSKTDSGARRRYSRLGSGAKSILNPPLSASDNYKPPRHCCALHHARKTAT